MLQQGVSRCDRRLRLSTRDAAPPAPRHSSGWRDRRCSLGALLSDWAYSSTYQVQWINFASWLIAGARCSPVPRSDLGVIDASLRSARTAAWLLVGLLFAATFILGFVNALVHATDAWAAMPIGLILSVIVGAACARAVWVAFSLAPRKEMHDDATFPSLPRRVAALACAAAAAAIPKSTAIWSQSGPSEAAARTASEHGHRRSGGLGRPAPDRFPRAIRSRRSQPTSRCRARRWCCPTATFSSPRARAAARPKLRPKDFVAGYLKEQGIEPGQGRRPADPAARRRRRRHLRRARGVRRESQRALRPRADRQRASTSPTRIALVRFDYRPGADPGERAAGHGHAAAGGDQPPLDQGAGRQRRRPFPLCRHRLEQQYRRTRHGGRRRTARWSGRSMPRPARTRPFATGLRNPTALAIQPGIDQLWAVVNERDELGPNLVPDYLTSVREGAFYGWPYAYWGPNVDRAGPTVKTRTRSLRPSGRIMRCSRTSRRSAWPFRPRRWARASPKACSSASMAAGTASVPVGYKVIFVPFRGGGPPGAPIDFVTGFQADGKTMGPPGRGDRRPARRADRRRRPVEHDLADHSESPCSNTAAAGPAPRR